MSKFLSFAEAKKSAAKLNLKSSTDWKNLKKNRPENLPSEPWKTYKDDWQGWEDFLGKGKQEKAKTVEEKVVAKTAEAPKDEKVSLEPSPFIADVAVAQKTSWSLEEAVKSVPAIAQKTKHPKLSEKYQHINTEKVIQNILESDPGWEIVSVKSTMLRDTKVQKYTHHVVKLENTNYKLIGDDKIQIILSNSHNGVSKFEFFFGIFRKICSNGLVVKEAMFNGINKKHFSDYEQINSYIVECVERIKELRSGIESWKEKILTKKQKLDLAIKGLHARYQYKNSYLELMYEVLKERYDIENLIVPVRREDSDDSLWTVFNIIQEKISKGLYYAKTDRGLSKANPIKNIHCELQFNKLFWQYASEVVNGNVED